MIRWKLKFYLLLIVAIPAFSGILLKDSEQMIVPGLSLSWLLYLFGVHLIVLSLMGIRRYGKITGIASLIILPVIFSGASLSYLLWFIKSGHPSDAYGFGAHYLSLLITMLTVIPLSLAIVAVLPFGSFEQHLLQRKNGVSSMEKRFLIAVRVFNHTVFDVLPNILEVLREESGQGSKFKESHENTNNYILKKIVRRPMKMILMMIQISVEGICTTIQYIPLWAVEISQLPNRGEID
jgi:hypothetical protein